MMTKQNIIILNKNMMIVKQHKQKKTLKNNRNACLNIYKINALSLKLQNKRKKSSQYNRKGEK